MRTPLVIGNWKMHGTQADMLGLLNDLSVAYASEKGGLAKTEAVVCPPYVHIAGAAQKLAGTALAWGAQNCAIEQQGAFTGEISAAMLADLKCTYVLLGHSERRSLFNETDSSVARKVGMVLANGLKPVVCVGETLGQREAGETLAVVTRQLNAVLDGFEIDSLSDMVLAYEPVWAIGTGLTASPEQAQAVHAHLRQCVEKKDPALGSNMRLLYGGSVKADNAAQLFGQPDIDGGLIGGASLKAPDFLAICDAAGK